MNILGLNYYFHDSTACIVKDDKLLIAIEEERLTRDKHTFKFPHKAISRCMSDSNIKPEAIDAIAVSIKPELDWFKKVIYCIKNFPKSLPLIKYELKLYYWQRKEFNSWITKTWPNKKLRPPVHYVPHHLSHAAGTFYVSPYDSAAILSVDGSGEWACSMLGHGQGLDVETFSTSYFPNPLGSVYESVTQFCGFKPCYDEGKTMGLAPLETMKHLRILSVIS